jgi:lysozyme family protein
MGDSTGMVIKRPYSKSIFTRADVEVDQADNKKDGAASEITEDGANFYLTTTWPPITTPTDTEPPAAATSPSPPPAANAAAAKVASEPAAAPAAGASASAKVALEPAAPAAEKFTTLSARDLPSLRPEYQRFFDLCQPLSANRNDVAKAAGRVQAGHEHYQTLSARLGGHIPWQFLGITHLLEANCSFNRHLHNGDPMFSGPDGAKVWLRTTHVPPNRPPIWPAPASESDPWIWSAMDAVTLEGFNNEDDWSIPAMLWRFERFNGMGYRQFHNPSPYLWSYSQIYQTGKFGSDGHYDPDLVSDQCGAALILKSLFAT